MHFPHKSVYAVKSLTTVRPAILFETGFLILLHILVRTKFPHGHSGLFFWLATPSSPMAIAAFGWLPLWTSTMLGTNLLLPCGLSLAHQVQF